jgi:membrane protein implicated in regulation of membrane protease activity
MDNAALLIWLCLTVFFIAVEALTSQLVSVWFIIGSMAAFAAAFAGLDVLWQAAVFFAVSVACLLLLRPIARKKAEVDNVPTNADRLIGGVGVVTATIDNTAGLGRVLIDGGEWMARSLTGERLAEKARVTVRAIEGVKLIVYPNTEGDC